MTAYHEIFIPFPDVYRLAGPNVFRETIRKEEEETNLLVIPHAFVHELSRIKREELDFGAEDTLDYLTEEVWKSDRERIDGFVLHRFRDNLHVAYLDDPEITLENSEVLIERIQKNFPSKHPPLCLTNEKERRLRLDAKGLRIEEPELVQVDESIVNEGIIEGTIQLQSALYQNKGRISLADATDILGRELSVHQFVRFLGRREHEYAIVAGKFEYDRSRGTRVVNVRDLELRKLERHLKEINKISIGNHKMDGVLGIHPYDMEQYLALQYGLLNPDVSLLFLCGGQGSGKTLLAYVAAVELILWYDKQTRPLRGQSEIKDGGFFKQIVFLKSIDILGGKRREIGFLPGDMYEKISNHLQSYVDAHGESTLASKFPFEDMIKHPRFSNQFGEPRSDQAKNAKINEAAYLPGNMEAVQMTYSGFMRGRTFRDRLVVIDEAQNFTPYELKTIIERAGEGAKYIVLGDPLQLDNPFCSRKINGLTSGIQHYLRRPYSCLINLTKNYRHQMSEDAKDWRVYSGGS
ncbi:MAG: PhoH family protein [Nanoarchaeota archaeon]